MDEVLKGIDWGQALCTLWTVVLLPIITYMGAQINDYAKAKRIDKYTDILYKNVLNAVKDVWETAVKGVKGTDGWDGETQEYVKGLAKTKAINALSMSAYQALKAANQDFDGYLDSLVEAALYDLKKRRA